MHHIENKTPKTQQFFPILDLVLEIGPEIEQNFGVFLLSHSLARDVSESQF